MGSSFSDRLEERRDQAAGGGGGRIAARLKPLDGKEVRDYIFGSAVPRSLVAQPAERVAVNH